MTQPAHLVTVGNGRAIGRGDIPELALSEFRQAILDAVTARERVVSLFGVAGARDDAVRLYVIIADDQESRLHVGTTIVTGDEFQSLTPSCLQVQLFEREIAEAFGLVAYGHPWFKPVRYHQ